MFLQIYITDKRCNYYMRENLIKMSSHFVDLIAFSGLDSESWVRSVNILKTQKYKLNLIKP